MKLALSCTRALRQARITRQFTTTVPRYSATPWFMDPETSKPAQNIVADEDVEMPPHMVPDLTQPAPPIPENIPDALKELHAQLIGSPHLEPATLVVRRPVPFLPGPPLPHQIPKGRRRRGGTNVGEGVQEPPNSLWKWVLMAQVKEGTEDRGAIESVVRVVRKTLLGMTPPIALPQNKKSTHNGWAMVDAGQFAIHITSKEIWERHFHLRQW